MVDTHEKRKNRRPSTTRGRKVERNKMMLDMLRLRAPQRQLQQEKYKLWIKYWNRWKKSTSEKIKSTKNQNRHHFLPGNNFLSRSFLNFYFSLSILSNSFTYVRLVYIISSPLCSAHVYQLFSPSSYMLILCFSLLLLLFLLRCHSYRSISMCTKA